MLWKKDKLRDDEYEFLNVRVEGKGGGGRAARTAKTAQRKLKKRAKKRKKTGNNETTQDGNKRKRGR